MARQKGPIRYAVVGLGHIAQVAVLPAFAHARRNSRLTALVSDDATKIKVLAKKYQVEGTYSNRGGVVPLGQDRESRFTTSLQGEETAWRATADRAIRREEAPPRECEKRKRRLRGPFHRYGGIRPPMHPVRRGGRSSPRQCWRAAPVPRPRYGRCRGCRPMRTRSLQNISPSRLHSDCPFVPGWNRVWRE